MASKTKKTTKTAKANFTANLKTNLKTPAIVRKGFRAYVGVFGAAYEAALPRYEKAVKNATKSYDDYAARGEKLEAVATTYANDTTKTVVEFAKARFEKRSEQLRSFIPGTAKGRVVELEAEIAKLNKKIGTLAKAAPKTATKTAKKVVTTVTSKTPKAA